MEGVPEVPLTALVREAANANVHAQRRDCQQMTVPQPDTQEM